MDSDGALSCPDSRWLDHFCNLMIVQDSAAGFGLRSLSAGGRNQAADQVVAVKGVNANTLPTQFAHVCTFSANLHPDLDLKTCLTRC